jgi:hypothetical protein
MMFIPHGTSFRGQRKGYQIERNASMNDIERCDDLSWQDLVHDHIKDIEDEIKRLRLAVAQSDIKRAERISDDISDHVNQMLHDIEEVAYVD